MPCIFNEPTSKGIGVPLSRPQGDTKAGNIKLDVIAQCGSSMEFFHTVYTFSKSVTPSGRRPFRPRSAASPSASALIIADKVRPTPQFTSCSGVVVPCRRQRMPSVKSAACSGSRSGRSIQRLECSSLPLHLTVSRTSRYSIGSSACDAMQGHAVASRVPAPTGCDAR